MKVKVELMGIISAAPSPDGVMELAEGATIETVLKKLKFKKIHYKYITANRNGEEVPTDTTLSNGDKVKLFMPVGGG
jgi:sulfur carrier protein ThiS